MRFIRANKIYPISTAPVENGILVLDETNHILDVLNSSEGLEENRIENHEGSICPGFINTHCHLELSHLLGKIPENKGLISFAKEVMGQRGRFSTEEMQAAMETADAEMRANGIVAVGDISNVPQSFALKAKSMLYYHTFIELIGLNPANTDKILGSGFSIMKEALSQQIPASLVPHAPYSTSYEVMKQTAVDSALRRVPISIHNQESREENLLFQSKSGGYLDLYTHLNLPIDYFEASGKSSLKTYLPYMERAHALLLVHNTFSSAEDLAFANQHQKNVYWCLCPNANLYIENTLPDVMQMLENKCKLTIGTDSLASNHQLSIANELQVLQSHFPELSVHELLSWATLNGAQFLGIDNQYGSLEKGKEPGLVLIDEKDFRVKKVL